MSPVAGSRRNGWLGKALALLVGAAIGLAVAVVFLVDDDPGTALRPPAGTASTTSSGVTDPELYREIGELRSTSDSHGDQLKFVLGFLALLFSLSVTGFALAERRERAAQSRATQAHDLAISGESAAQARAAEVHTRFLEGSVTTLNLVNHTLELERRASERAAEAGEQKARTTLEELDLAAKELVSRVPPHDDHALVTDQARRAKLQRLARRIEKYEINRAMLTRDIPLSPHCQFIRGMQLHLEEHFDEAFEEWGAVALNDAAAAPLKSLTWYWIGRERTNLAMFDEADQAFEQALENAPEARRYEIERIRLELRFFDAKNYDAEQLIGDLQALEKRLGELPGDAARKVLPHVRSTLANVHYEVAHEHFAKGEHDVARRHFETTAGIFRSIRHEKWAALGLAEACWWLGKEERKKAEELFAGDARRFARSEYVHRVEHRAKVMARSAELLCCARAESIRGEVDHLYHDVVTMLGDVDGRMTVYSELQRRNVDKRAFLDDLDTLIAQAEHVPPPLGQGSE